MCLAVRPHALAATGWWPGYRNSNRLEICRCYRRSDRRPRNRKLDHPILEYGTAISYERPGELQGGSRLDPSVQAPEIESASGGRGISSQLQLRLRIRAGYQILS